MATITPFLWFDNTVEEAVAYYQAIFPNTRVHSINRAPDGRVLTAEFEVEGQRFIALNGGPEFRFNEAVSFFVSCEDQAEVDRYWSLLTADGGEESQCGWLKDKFGLSWQIIPRAFTELMQRDEPEKVHRMMTEMLQMKKLEMPRLERAFDGTL